MLVVGPLGPRGGYTIILGYTSTLATGPFSRRSG
jgi:hypothetical protein